MSSPPLGDIPFEEIDDKPVEAEHKDPGFHKIHSSIGDQLNRLFHGARYPDGQVIDFLHVTPQTAQQVVNWYKRKLYCFQLYRLRLTYNPKHYVIQFKASHPAGEALTKAFTSGLMSWFWNYFRDIGEISRFLSKKFRILPYCPSPTMSPVPPKIPFLTPVLAVHPDHEAYDIDFPPIIIDYTFSPTDSSSELFRHWHDLYRSRDLWFSHSKAKTQVVILAVFHPAAADDNEEEPNQNMVNNNNNRIRIHGRMDVWRYDKHWKTGRLTDEIVLFPPPSTTTLHEEQITFSLEEIFGRSCDFRFEESGIQEDMTFVLDVEKLREEMKAYRWDTSPSNEDDRARYLDMFS
ncbi:uncharacterized protein DFL_006755 [Arthrobotrys flagrans]|uniref:Uncharacterized protein n=1 Tax=Arthrobotrys flagrans TaxID=97331 RepID=A0A436ZTP3_ARTFL|nr:hypothetical protein DFL_006755 [Arthrobotrys flagrans]